MSISQTADKLAAHRWGGTDANTLRAYCHCGWEANVLASGPAHRDHQAEMLEPLIVAREHEASRQALTNAADQLEPGTPGNTYLYELADEIDLHTFAREEKAPDPLDYDSAMDYHEDLAAEWIRSRAEQ